MFCRGNTVRVGLTRRGGHEDRAGRVPEHLERHAAAQPGRKLAAATTLPGATIAATRR